MVNPLNQRIWAVIPAFNESGTISQVARLTARFVDRVLVVDDHSTDETPRRARDAGALVLSNLFDRGAHLATLYGVGQSTSSDIIVTLDADGQHSPAQIPKLIAPILNDTADFVLGRRPRPPPSEERVREVASAIVNADAQLDVGTGFRTFRTRLLSGMTPRESGLCGCGSFLLYAHRRGARISEVPVAVLPRRVGRSKFANVRKNELHARQAELLLREYSKTA